MMQEFFSLPSYPGYSPNPVEAVSSVPPEGLLQIVAFISWLEIISNKGKVRTPRAPRRRARAARAARAALQRRLATSEARRRRASVCSFR